MKKLDEKNQNWILERQIQKTLAWSLVLAFCLFESQRAWAGEDSGGDSCAVAFQGKSNGSFLALNPGLLNELRKKREVLKEGFSEAGSKMSESLSPFSKIMEEKKYTPDQTVDLLNTVLSTDIQDMISNGENLLTNSTYYKDNLETLKKGDINELSDLGEKIQDVLIKLSIVLSGEVPSNATEEDIAKAVGKFKRERQSKTLKNRISSMAHNMNPFVLMSRKKDKTVVELMKEMQRDAITHARKAEIIESLRTYSGNLEGYVQNITGIVAERLEEVKGISEKLIKGYGDLFALQQDLEIYRGAVDSILIPDIEGEISSLESGKKEGSINHKEADEKIENLNLVLTALKGKSLDWMEDTLFLEIQRQWIKKSYEDATVLVDQAKRALGSKQFALVANLKAGLVQGSFQKLLQVVGSFNTTTTNLIKDLEEQNQKMSLKLAAFDMRVRDRQVRASEKTAQLKAQGDVLRAIIKSVEKEKHSDLRDRMNALAIQMEEDPTEMSVEEVRGILRNSKMRKRMEEELSPLGLNINQVIENIFGGTDTSPTTTQQEKTDAVTTGANTTKKVNKAPLLQEQEAGTSSSGSR